MTECWSEGELRAYIDRELPPKDMERLAAHLESCRECGGRYAEVSQRAARVGTLVEMLPAPEAVAWVPRAPARAGTGRRWAAAAMALAAVLTLAYLMLPKRVGPQALKVVPRPPAVAPQAPAETPPVVQPAIIRRSVPRRHGTPQRPLLRADYFLALDDEPMQTGVVMRVALGAAEVKADVIFGSDGRARAIRLVNEK